MALPLHLHLTPSSALATGRSAVRRIFAVGRPLIGVALMVAAVAVLWTQYRDLSGRDLLHQAASWGPGGVATAVALCAASFALLGVLEWLGLHWSGVSVRLRTALIGSTIVNGITHSLGANVVVATFARSWAYRRAGLRLLPSATTTLFGALSFALGLAAMVGLGLAVADGPQLRAAGLGVPAGRALAIVLLSAPTLYVIACTRWPLAPLTMQLRLPDGPLALGQVVIGVVDNILAAAILWMLIGAAAPPFQTFVLAYAIACLIGLASASPGGLGVFEASLLLVLPDTDPQALAGGMIGFRLIFYLLPLLVALGLAVWGMIQRQKTTPGALAADDAPP
ncbi:MULTISPECIES: lysylphosphatidylglycerol synthase domain-containing protein [unclassified Brevundimonas]|uniref:lysylphosphatidylglycerol synthase domain-containing protein n=1 Tax=unclassified Brevundimonas TaxID=2622653 RepID=UPI003F92ACDD